MIVLDATVVIALLDRHDGHHDAAVLVLTAHADESLLISPITRAEVLVGPARAGRLADAIAALEQLGVEEVALPDDAAVRLAELRVETGSKLPDCCVLLAAQQRSAAVATFDDRLRSSAERLGVAVRA